MDLPKDKGQTDYQAVSVFSILAGFATLGSERTANLRLPQSQTAYPDHQSGPTGNTVLTAGVC